MKRFILLILATAFLAIPLAAENLIIENSSFEAGNWGFDAVPYAWVRSWPQVVQPQVVDETAAHGRFSLRLDNGSGHDAAWVSFPAVAPGSPALVTLSFYARSADEGTPILAELNCGWKVVLSGTVKLSREWRRYHVSGEVGKDLLMETRNAGRPGWYAPTFRLLPVNQPMWKTVWLDAIQVERGGSASDYAPAHALDASLDLADHAARRLLVYDLGETPVAELRVAAAQAGPFSATWRLRDVLGDQVLAEGRLDGATDAQGCALATFPLPAVARRLYRLEATVSAAGVTAEAQRTYGGIADRSRLPGGPFGGSIESFEPGRQYYLGLPDPTRRLAHWRETPETYIAFARRMGWSWIHLYKQTAPELIMPEPGVFHFEDTDSVVDLLRANDLEIMALLSSHGNYNTIYSFPEWMKTGPKSLGGTSRGKGAPLIDLAAWERWCSAMATRYRGKIAAWEDWNEPGVKMREAEYLPYNRAAWRAIKAADPQATVLGLCGTWDVGGDLYGWVKQCLKLGAGETMDGIAIHGYHSRDRDYVARVRQIAREITGRDYPIWDTETGVQTYSGYGQEPHFVPEGDVPMSAFTATSAAERLVSHTANELACGVERLSWFNLSVGWTTQGMPGYSMLMFDGAPDMAVIAQNFVIEAFQDAKPYSTLTPAGGVVVYVFERPVGPLLVYWSEEESSTARLAVEGSRLTDYLGGELPTSSANGWTTLPIDRQPRFLTVPGLDAAALAAAAASLEVRGVQPLRRERIVHGLRDGQPALLVTLANRTNVDRPMTLAVRRMPSWLGAMPAWQGTLPALGRTTATLPLTIGTPDADGSLRLVAESNEHVLALPLELRVITADAEPRAWPLADWCSISVAHDADGLRVHGEIRDDQVVNHQDCTSAELAEWQGDCVELFFDWEREADQDRFLCDSDDTQIFCPPPGMARPAQVTVAKPHNVGNFPVDRLTYQAVRTPAGWSFELAIPWSCVEALGCKRQGILGFAVSVRDFSADWSLRRRTIWGGNNDNHKDTSGYGLLILR
jgi:hypothetical protein